MLLFRLLPASFALILLGAALGLGNHLLRFEGLFPLPAEAAVVCGGEGAGSEPLHQTPQEASTLCANQAVLVLDVRDAGSFARGHVAEAIHLPCSLTKLEAAVTDRLEGSETILVYGGDTEEAVPVARSLLLRGHTDVRVIDGGYPAWESAHLACVSGPCEACVEVHPQGGDHPQGGTHPEGEAP